MRHIKTDIISGLHGARTSADVENVVVSVLGLDSVHGYLGQLPPARLCLQQDRSVVLGKHGTIHHRVGSDKPQHLVRELLRGGEAASVHLTGTLWKEGCERKKETRGQ